MRQTGKNRAGTSRRRSPSVLSVGGDRAQTPHPIPVGEPMDIDDPAVNVEILAGALDLALAEVLEVIPDVTPDYARMLCERFIPEFGQGASAPVVNLLIENPGYPKV